MKNFKEIIFFIVFVSILFFTTAEVFAEHTKYGPPCVNDDAGIEPKGKYELGYSTVFTEDPGLATTTTRIALTYGVVEHLEIGIVPQVYDNKFGSDISDVYDVGDVSLVSKYQIPHSEDSKSIYAIKLSDKFAVSSSAEKKSLSSGENDHELTLINSRYIKGTQLDLNFSYKYRGEPSNKDYSDEITVGVTHTFPLGDFLIEQEIVGKNDYTKSNITLHDYKLDYYIGLKWIMAEKLYWKTAVGTRVTENAPDLLGCIAVSYYF